LVNAEFPARSFRRAFCSPACSQPDRRLLYGHVIDFLLFDLHLPFAHSMAGIQRGDSCICVAVVFFIINSFRQEKKAPATKGCSHGALSP